MMSDFRYEIKTSLPVIWLENIDTKNPGWFVRNEHEQRPADPGWSGWRWRRDPGPQTSDSQLTMRDLKKRKNIVIHSSWSNRSSLYSTLALANI
jgi:hypothetical protein